MPTINYPISPMDGCYVCAGSDNVTVDGALFMRAPYGWSETSEIGDYFDLCQYSGVVQWVSGIRGTPRHVHSYMVYRGFPAADAQLDRWPDLWLPLPGGSAILPCDIVSFRDEVRYAFEYQDGHSAMDGYWRRHPLIHYYLAGADVQLPAWLDFRWPGIRARLAEHRRTWRAGRDCSTEPERRKITFRSTNATPLPLP